jgi:glycosyltransferase involved in cell wall biosynthesis
VRIVLLQDDYPPESRGGAGNVVAALSTALVREGHAVSVITSTQRPDAVGLDEWRGVEVHRLYSDYHERWRAYRSLYNPRTVGHVARILEAIRPDVIHIHNIHQHLSYRSISLARRYTDRVILTAHDVMLFDNGKCTEFIDPADTAVRPADAYDYKVTARQQLGVYKRRFNPFRNVVIRHCVRDVDHVVAVSEALKFALGDNGFARVNVVHNGVEVEPATAADATGAAFRERYRLGKTKVMLLAGRVGALKGGERALRMLEAIAREGVDGVLVTAAPFDAYARRMQQLAEHLGIGDRFVCTGWLSGDDVRAAYAASDVVVVPSICLDCFPLVTLEAMAAAKPVVATCYGGAPEAVTDGETGYIVNPYDIDSFSSKVRLVLEDPQLAERLGREGRRRLDHGFRVGDMAQQYLALYQR